MNEIEPSQNKFNGLEKVAGSASHALGPEVPRPTRKDRRLF